jgi:hypothetical protein
MRLGKIAHQQQNNTHDHTTPRRGRPNHARTHFAARCSQPLSTNQTPHPTTKAERQPDSTRPTLSPGPDHTHRFPRKDEAGAGLLSQSPIVCSVIHPPTGTQVCCVHQNLKPTTGQAHLHESLHSPNPHTMWAGRSLVVLLRKEVIQPHLPVRLPCYDFVPIADPTFDRSLPDGLGHGLRVLPTFMT